MINGIEKEKLWIFVNHFLRHKLGYKQEIQVIWRNKVCFSSTNVSTDTTVIGKD